MLRSVCLLSLLVSCAHSAALAGEMPGGKSEKGVRPGTCVGYGPGFVPVAGTETCVRVSGHVRVEYGWGKTPAGNSHGGSDMGTSAYAPEPPPIVPEGGPVFGRLKPRLPIGERPKSYNAGLKQVLP